MVIFQKRVAGLTESALARFVTRAARSVNLQGSVNIMVTTSHELKKLNRRFRHKDEATDVLSFPAIDPASTRSAGDIAVSADIAARNARQLRHSAVEEVKILVLHGILHLKGYDHECDDGRMAKKEAQLRQVFRLPTGLIERAAAVRKLSQPSGRKGRGAR